MIIEAINSQQPLVLVVDDQYEIAQLVEFLLEDEGYQAISCTESAKVLEVVLEHKPALILLDVNMPVVDGWEVLESLRRNPATRTLPVIMMTAASDKIESYSERLNHYKADLLKKPFNNQKLLDKVKNAVSSYRTAQVKLACP